jgi:hypothetical protein
MKPCLPALAFLGQIALGRAGHTLGLVLHIPQQADIRLALFQETA